MNSQHPPFWNDRAEQGGRGRQGSRGPLEGFWLQTKPTNQTHALRHKASEPGEQVEKQLDSFSMQETNYKV